MSQPLDKPLAKGFLDIGATRLPWKRVEAEVAAVSSTTSEPSPSSPTFTPTLFPISMLCQWLNEDRLAAKNAYTADQLAKYVSSSQTVSSSIGQMWLSPDGVLKLVYLFGTPSQQITATKKLLPFFEGISL